MDTNTPFSFNKDFDEKYLFVDPLLEQADGYKHYGAILLAEEIKKYITKYGLLIANDFYLDDLKGASYSMRPDPNYKAWRFGENGEKTTLYRGKDQNFKYYYEVPPNSLVYIRLRNKLRLPYYLIGRFNLKVTYAYKGLLLGTGPQVDPGYEQYLNIPLHNFTEKYIRIYIEKSFVSIDFVRTASLNLNGEVPKSRSEFLDEKYRKWKSLRSRLRPQIPDKLYRNEIEDYVKDVRPVSFLGGFVPKLQENEKKIEDSLIRLKKSGYWNWAVSVAILLALFAAMYTAYFHLDTRLETKELSIRNELQRFRAIEVKQNEIEQKLDVLVQQSTQSQQNKIKEKDNTDVRNINMKK